jgi:putative ABC transport system permease protein
MNRLIDRLKYLLLPSYRRAQEAEMQEELESLAAIAGGRRELGNITTVAERTRESVWTWTWIENLQRDLQYAFRTMRQNPGFTATAVLSLALGIGANTAIFSLIDALLLRSLPTVPNPEQLLLVQLRSAKDKTGAPGESFSNAITNGLAAQKEIFAGVGGFSAGTFDAGPKGSIHRVRGAWVTGEFYSTLGIQPVLGRLLGPEDDKEGAPLAAVISFDYWQRQFAGDPSVTSRTVPINGLPVSIVGVTPRGFQGANVGSITDISMATGALPQLDPAMASLLKPGNFWLRVLARPRAGVTPAQARERLNDVVWPQIAESVISPSWPASERANIRSSRFEFSPGGTGYSYLRKIFTKPLMVLMGVAGLVLLIACANVASLSLARATARQREISVRLAIGAGRGRIVRQLLTETTLLSLIGASVGVFLAWLSAQFLVSILAVGAAQAVLNFDLTPNWHVLGFATAVALANGVLFGLAPALQTTSLAGLRSPVSLRDESSARVAGSSRQIALSALVVAQVSLSLLLLVGAGLFAKTFQNLLETDPGFQREGVLLVEIDGQREGFKRDTLHTFNVDLLERVRRVPGVASAALATHTPLSGSTWSEAAVPKGQTLPERDNATFIGAGPAFFATLQTPLLAGREFTEQDRGMTTPTVAIVNQSYVNRHFPKGENPVGQYLTSGITKPPSDLRIIGVVKDVITRDLRTGPKPVVYVSYFQRAPRVDNIVIRTSGGSISQVAAAVAKELQGSFPTTPVEVRGLNEQVEQTIVQERLMAHLATGFGVLGLVLACVGLYGLLGYTVVRRTKEIGIRMALGAGRSGVLRMVAGRAARLVILGVAAGLPLAWLVSRWVQSMLFGLRPMDPGVIAGAVLLLAVAALLAAFLPAHRASRVDPITALRHD